MAGNFNLRAIISATDRLTPVLRGQMRTMRSWQRQFQTMGRGAVPIALGLGAAIAVPAKAFMDAENAAKNLENALMQKGGLTPGFKQLDVVATKLGQDLPGSTKDFYNLAAAMKSAGMSTDILEKGGLKAAAYLGAVTQDFPSGGYDMAGQTIAHMGTAFQIADKDMLAFADSLQRVIFTGADMTDLNYALQTSVGVLDGIGIKGLQAAKDTEALVAAMARVGIVGSQAGTGLRKLFMVYGMKGAKSVDQIYRQLELTAKRHPEKALANFKDWFGEEHAAKMLSLVSGGKVEAIKKEMEAMASLDEKAANKLGALSNLIEAASGTLENAEKSFASSYAPEMKAFAVQMNAMIGTFDEFFKKNGKMIKIALETVAALAAFKFAALGVSMAIGAITAAMRFMTVATPLGWIMLFVQALVVAAPLIYENWDKITAYFKDHFGAAIDWISDKWSTLVKAFTAVHDFFGGAENIQQHGMRPPGYQQQSIVKSGRMSGGIDVNFNGVPTGTRVIPYTKGPISVTPNVGYRSLGMAQ